MFLQPSQTFKSVKIGASPSLGIITLRRRKHYDITFGKKRYTEKKVINFD